MLFFVGTIASMDKSSLRVKYKTKRQALTDDLIEQKSLEIANQLLPLSIWSYTRFHLFLSSTKKREINTAYILTLLFGKDKEVVVPKMEKESQLTHFLLTDNTPIHINSFGIPEPKNGIPVDPSLLEVVFVPLLAFDSKGNRIGYGKGFYDRFLTQCSEDCIKIGLSFFPPESNLIDIEPTDVRLDYCVTPEKIYQFF